MYVIYLVWMLPDNIFALPTRTTLSFTETLWPSGSFHLYSCHECFYPRSSAIQELFTDILCYIIGWYPHSLLKNLNNFEKVLHFKATILTTSSKVVKDFLWQKSVFDHILWKSVDRPTITYDYPHAILSGKGKK